MSKKTALLIPVILVVSIIRPVFCVHPAKGIVWIGGHISSDTIWEPLNTYRLINNTYIDPGVTLTIEPGVEVQFADGFSLIVEGSLNSTGTDSNPIVFTSSRVAEDPPDPSAGSWNTIAFKGNRSEHFSIKYSIVEYAIDGLTIQSIDAAIIENNVIVNCSGNGITLKGNSNVTIAANTIMSNMNGISTGYWKEDVSGHSGINASDNVITLNQEFGVFLDSYGGSRPSDPDPFGTSSYLYDVAVLSNNISYNGKDAIVIQSQGLTAEIRHINVSNNTVSSNGGNGVSLSTIDIGRPTGHIYLHDVAVLHNNISHNEGAGIYMFSGNGYGGDIFDVAILNNTVFSNAGSGIYLVGSAPDRIGRATIYDVVVSANLILFNDGNGVHLNCRERISIYADGIIKNIALLTNRLINNRDSGIRGESKKRSELAYDLFLSENTMLDNYYGVYLGGALKTNITANSIGYNIYGVFYSNTKDNLVQHNDIYDNIYGMNVSDGATVTAEDNYWGHSTGPNHELLNAEGGGNSVNGNGTELVFIPFLTSPVSTIDKRLAQSQVQTDSATIWKTYEWNHTFFSGHNVYQASIMTLKNWQVDGKVNVTFRLNLIAKSTNLNYLEPVSLAIELQGTYFMDSSKHMIDQRILENVSDYWEENITFTVPTAHMGRGQTDNVSITFKVIYNQIDLEGRSWQAFYLTTSYGDPLYIDVSRPFLSTAELIIITIITAVVVVALLSYRKKRVSTLKRKPMSTEIREIKQ